jgi:5-methyltetrahydrofolate--homocysteine methyltransferase
MNALIEELLADTPILTDGAWATQLQVRGLPIGDCPDAWNLTHPDRVEALARDYVAAGSRVLLTNTFGANRIALARHGLGSRVEEINRAGVALSRRAAGGAARVFASMGPTGCAHASSGVSAEEMRAAFAEQARALALGGAEGIVIETMMSLAEAEIALGAARETGLPVVACMLFGVGRADGCTIAGETPEQAARALEAAGADVIGANCGEGAAGFVPICARLRAATRLPLWIKPNAELPEWVDGRPVYRTTPEAFAVDAAAIVRAGADFIGGCCGTGPEFIRALRQLLAPGS